MQTESFDYDEAFSRNIGWVTPWEQQILRRKKIAIAGMGGVGGIYLLTLARLGFENFHIADPDTFELANFNRQLGAARNSLGRTKVDVLTELALEINPLIKIKSFPRGVTDQNLDDFLADVDLFIDGLDFFVLNVRQKIFGICQKNRIPAMTAGPLGMSVAYIIFMPGQMSFADYFGFDEKTPEINTARFLAGLNPRATHLSYLVDPSAVKLKEKKGPSTMIGCNLSAAVVAAEAIKIILGRGKIYAAPWYHCFDAYRNIYSRNHLTGGSRNWLQSLRVLLAPLAFTKYKNSTPSQPPAVYHTILEKILDQAKWAPSIDNTQPWRFEILSENEVNIHFEELNSWWDYDQIPSTLTVGFFLESFQLAASHFHYRTQWEVRDNGQTIRTVHIRIIKDEHTHENPLSVFLKIRSVNRFPYKMGSLSERQKDILSHSLGHHLKIKWFEHFTDRLTISMINARATSIRLRMKDSYLHQKHVWELHQPFSKNQIPIKSLGVSLALQQWLVSQFQTEQRFHFINTLLRNTFIQQTEQDIAPGVCCSAHFMIEWANSENVKNKNTRISAGQALQNFWLTLTQMGLSMQPQLSTMALAYYGKNHIPFDPNIKLQKRAAILAEKLDHIAPINNLLFIGRIGIPQSKLIRSRSVRKDLSELMKS